MLMMAFCMQGKNVLRKEPMGKEVEETDVFSVNDGFTSKFYKVKVGTISAQKDSEPEKLETRQKVEEDRKPQVRRGYAEAPVPLWFPAHAACPSLVLARLMVDLLGL